MTIEDTVKLGIIICDRYRTCAGGKCMRALRNRIGAFERYRGRDVELVGFATCNGCPGGNIEYAPEEMKKTVRISFILQPGRSSATLPAREFPILAGLSGKSMGWKLLSEHIRFLRNIIQRICISVHGIGNVERADCTNTHG